MPRRTHTIPTSGFSNLFGIAPTTLITSPAAGTEWSYTLPGGYFYRILSGTALFTSSAAVANRFPALQLTDGANLLWCFNCPVAVTASQTARVVYSPSSYTQNVTGPKGDLPVFAPNMWIPPNYVLSSSTPAIDVADTYTKIVFWFEQLDYGQYGIPELAHDPTLDELEHIPAKYDVEV